MKAFITGISGCVGNHLTRFLLHKGYKVYGLVRRQSTDNLFRLNDIVDKIELIKGDITDGVSISNALKKCMPDEVYNLAAQSSISYSLDSPVSTVSVTGLGALQLIENIRQICPKAKVYQAGSSEQFGRVKISPQDESTPFYPRNPYGRAKVFAHNIMKIYRESYGLNISCGIAFNHDDEYRGTEFLSRKITDGVSRIMLKLQNKIPLGNLESKRDWGYAPDYVEAFWLILQNKPDDYVIATGESRSVKDFLQTAVKAVGLPGDWEDYYARDERFIRPSEIDNLVGNASKLYGIGWRPRTPFKEWVKKMVDCDYNRLCTKYRL